MPKTKVTFYAKILIYFQLLFVVCYKMLVEVGVPYSIRYVTYLVMVPLVILTMMSGEWKKLRPHAATFAVILLWWVVTTISAVINDFSPLLVIWATANWCKGFVFLAVCLIFLKKEDYLRLYRWMMMLYALNFGVVLVQYIGFGYYQDYLGGIFGTELGCNGAMNTFMCILLIPVLLEAFEKQQCSVKTVLYVVSSLIIAGLAELKIYFIEYVFVFVCLFGYYMLKKRMNTKMLLQLAAVSAFGYALGLVCMLLVSPGSFRVMVGLKSYAKYEETSRSSYKISRLRAIPEINEGIFNHDLRSEIIGLGLGNCEYSEIYFLVSKFYTVYADWNYFWCSHHILYLEGGLIGLGMYAMIFGQMMLKAAKSLLRKERTDPYALYLFLFAAITILGLVYNNDMRKEYAYLTCCVLAAGMSLMRSDPSTLEK